MQAYLPLCAVEHTDIQSLHLWMTVKSQHTFKQTIRNNTKIQAEHWLNNSYICTNYINICSIH